MGTDTTELRPLDLAVIGGTALAARAFNLGTFSLWLDEILLLLRARGGPAEVWAACRANAEHPPLSAMAAAALNGAGATETVHRLLTIALGVATVLLLAVWAGRRFGRAAGLATGLVTALVPFHVRYSQELRPYAYLLFFAVLTLLAADRLERRPGIGSAALAFGAILGGFYSHHLFALVLIPAAWPLAEATLSRKDRRGLGLFAIAAGAAFLLFLPWLLAITGELSGRDPTAGAAGARPWTWRLALQRWQFLTAGAMEGDALTWAGILALGLAGIGAVAALRSPAGRAAVVGAVLGIGGAEVFMAATDHWSSGRYDAVGWLFLPVLLGLGIASLSTVRQVRLLEGVSEVRPARRESSPPGPLSHLPPTQSPGEGETSTDLSFSPSPGGGRWGDGRGGRGVRTPRADAAFRDTLLAVLVLAALLVGQGLGLMRYARVGRPDWDRVAAAVRQARQPGEPVLAENEWTRICLGYYLQGPDFLKRQGEDGAPVAVEAGPRRLRQLWPADRRAVLVVAGIPRQQQLRRWARSFPVAGRFPRSQARVFLLTPEVRQRLFDSGVRAAGPARKLLGTGS